MEKQALIKGRIHKLKSKKPKFGSIWNKRWFTVQVLNGGSGKELVLCYSSKKDAYDPNGWIFLREITHILYSHEISALLPLDQLDCHSFGYDVIQEEERAGLVIISESRNFLLKCDDEIEANMWVEGLRRICGLGNGEKWPLSLGAPPKPVAYLVQISKDKKSYLKYEVNKILSGASISTASSDLMTTRSHVNFSKEDSEIKREEAARDNVVTHTEGFTTTTTTTWIDKENKRIGNGHGSKSTNHDGTKTDNLLDKSFVEERKEKEIKDISFDEHETPEYTNDSEKKTTRSNVPIFHDDIDDNYYSPNISKLSVIEQAMNKRMIPTIIASSGETVSRPHVDDETGKDYRNKIEAAGSGGTLYHNTGGGGRDDDVTEGNTIFSDGWDSSEPSSPHNIERESKRNVTYSGGGPGISAKKIENTCIDEWDSDGDSSDENPHASTTNSDTEKSKRGDTFGAGVTTDTNWLNEEWDSD